MGTVAKNDGGDYTPPPQGTWPAVCSAVIDLGTHTNERWHKRQHRVLLSWELDVDEEVAPPPEFEGRPWVVHRRFTLSLHEKSALRPMLEAWRGRQFTEDELDGFDLANILGKPCLVTVTHKTDDGKTYANVTSVTALPKKLQPGPTATRQTYFDVEAPDMDIFATFGDKLRALITQAEEWKNGEGKIASDFGDDDIPF